MNMPIPTGLHHTAYITHDAEATVEFYTKVLGLELVSTVVDDEVPSTGDPFPYLHIFFALGDGSTIAFFESPGIPDPAKPSHQAYTIFPHLALNVESKDQIDQWAEKLRGLGVEVVGPVDHGLIYSIYFYDPNNLRLELTTTIDQTWQDHKDEASEDVKSWILAKQESKGSDPQAIFTWVKERRKKHKQNLL